MRTRLTRPSLPTCAVITSGGDTCAAVWGDLLATAAKARNAAGVVVDGAIRDRRQILEMAFPAFAAGLTPADNYGRLDLVELDVPIECAGARVAPGDLVLADGDGVVVIPRALAADAIRLAEEQTEGEEQLRAALSRGVGVEALFTEHGIL